MLPIIIAVLSGAIRSGTAVLFACLGEIIAERAGVVNLGTEGCMLIGALGAFAATAMTGNPFLGAFVGGLCGASLAAVHAYVAVIRRGNQLASGLAITILGLGVTSFFGRSFVATQINGMNSISIAGLSDLPILGPILFQHDALTYLAAFLAPGIWFVLYRTRWGLMLRATGERQDVVYSVGLSPTLIRCLAVICGGFLAGLGGAQLSVAYTLNWVENMTQGRGYVAVALVIFSSWSPLTAVAGSYLFGGALSLQLALQARGVGASPFLMSAIPYLVTLAVLVLVGRRRRQAMPDELRAVFERGG
ncbi:MAG: ABC transporter permease [Dehalococcoidia bacterium]|nr:ABC transporter permease [Dehalococcoidia bacterium]